MSPGTGSFSPMRLKLISCEILFREMCHVVARSPHTIDVEFLPKGLHDVAGRGMCRQVQEAVDRADADPYDAVLLGYLLCGRGVEGLLARTRPLVLPRGHDCITLFLGSRRRYQEFFESNPGVYFKTTGWIERGRDIPQLGLGEVQRNFGVASTFEELVEKYGEDNARYLWETLGNYTKNYGKLVFIRMGVGPEDRLEEETREEAAELGMAFERVEGRLTLFERLVGGEWDEEDFLVVPPGYRIVATHDERIVRAEAVS